MKKKETKTSFLEFFKINSAGTVKKEIQNRLKEQVPITDKICIKYVFSEKLYAIKFQGKPVKIKPLINSIKPKKMENVKKETTTFFE